MVLGSSGAEMARTRRFILRSNVKVYRNRLEVEQDETARKLLEVVLAESEAELKYQERIWMLASPHLRIQSDLAVALELQLNKIMEELHADFGSLQLWDPGTSTLRLIGQENLDHMTIDSFALIHPTQGTPCGIAQETRSRTIIEDVEAAHPPAAVREWARAMGITAVLSTPIFNQDGDVVGVCTGHYKCRPSVDTLRDGINPYYQKHIALLLAQISGS
ncbi:MAG TPA: GAF domain-containing protein [Rhodopila sp.]|nr:GAF domain-containing protein [Rhodopila sp.]